MSDASDKGSTAPMQARPRPATQVSASAVPSTKESPPEPPKFDATIRMEDEAPPTTEEISGTLVVNGGGEVPSEPLGRRAGAPSTKMSPAVDPQAFKGAAPDPRPEEAVTIAPAFPIVDRAAQARGGTFQSAHPGNYDAQGQYVPQAYEPMNARSRSGMSGAMIALIVAGLVLLVAALGVIVFVVVFLRARPHPAEIPVASPIATTSAAVATTATPSVAPSVASPPPHPVAAPPTAIVPVPPLATEPSTPPPKPKRAKSPRAE